MNPPLATPSTSVLLEPLETMAQRMLAVLPNVLAMSLILIGGVLLAWGARVLIERAARLLGLDRLSDRLGFTTALLRGGVKVNPSRMLGQTGYWIVLGFALLAAIGSGFVLARTAGVGRGGPAEHIVDAPSGDEVKAELDAAAERTRAARERARGELEKLEKGEPSGPRAPEPGRGDATPAPDGAGKR